MGLYVISSHTTRDILSEVFFWADKMLSICLVAKQLQSLSLKVCIALMHCCKTDFLLVLLQFLCLNKFRVMTFCLLCKLKSPTKPSNLSGVCLIDKQSNGENMTEKCLS